MGRVYNALLRAERWKDTDRPIGRPERNGAETGRGVEAAPVFSRDASSSSTASLGFEDIFDLTEDLTTPAYSESAAEPESAQVPVVSGDELAPRRVARLGSRPVSPSPAPSVATIKFEEPSEVSNIHHLAIDPHVAALTGEDLLAVERYRTLAVKLLNLADRRKVKTLLVTSAEAGEGKTTIATGAAWSLANHPGRRVLLIDASPTSSSVGRMLGIDPKRGWLNLLDGSCELKHALIRLEPNALYVLTPGVTAAPHSSDVSSSRLEPLIAELAEQFDLVVVDTGSILESSEAQHLATVLDGAVIVVRANHTHHGKVTAARRLVPKERRLGVVLNESGVEAPIPHRRSKGNRLVGRLFGRKR